MIVVSRGQHNRAVWQSYMGSRAEGLVAVIGEVEAAVDSDSVHFVLFWSLGLSLVVVCQVDQPKQSSRYRGCIDLTSLADTCA